MNPRLFIAMGCVGITTEIFFTAIYDLVTSPGPHDLSLRGHSFIWMFPIYGVTAFTFPFVLKKLHHWDPWQRALLYGLGILIFEYISGGILRFATGSCPWEYKTGLHIQGLIRLDYYPFWVCFGAGVERLITWLSPRLETVT